MSDQSNKTAPSKLSTVKGINHVGLSVSDLHAAMAFYSEVASLEKNSTSRFSNSAARKQVGSLTSLLPELL